MNDLTLNQEYSFWIYVRAWLRNRTLWENKQKDNSQTSKNWKSHFDYTKLTVIEKVPYYEDKMRIG
jgi:hypothetical protein